MTEETDNTNPSGVPTVAIDNVGSDDLPADEQLAAAELEDMKKRATDMGVTFHPSIGAEKLAKKVSEFIEEQEATNIKEARDSKLTEKQKTNFVARNEALKLRRVVVTCMDPMKKGYQGEIFSAGNSIIGTVTKYIHFETEWHVPQIILNILKNRKYQQFDTKSNTKGQTVNTTRMVRAYSITELPDLTEQELYELKQRSLMAEGAQQAA